MPYVDLKVYLSVNLRQTITLCLCCFTQSNYSGAIDDMDPDANVIKLNKDLSSIEEALHQSLQPHKFR